MTPTLFRLGNVRVVMYPKDHNLKASRNSKSRHSLKFGAKDLLDDAQLDSKNVKVRITTFVDEDILIKLKEYAQKSGSKYQTVLNSLLRTFFDKPEKANVQVLSEERVRRIVRDELKKRA